MRLVIFGSTGATGVELVRQALRRGHEVVAFDREPPSVTFVAPRLHLVRGDVSDLEAVRLAASGCDAAISVLSFREGLVPVKTRALASQILVQGLTDARIRRLVSCSAVRVESSLEKLPWLAQFLPSRVVGACRLEKAGLQEEVIRSSTLEWVILRPPRLVDDPGTGQYAMGNDVPSGVCAKLARADLARALLDQLQSNQHLHAATGVSEWIPSPVSARSSARPVATAA